MAITANKEQRLGVAALVTGAFIWGVIWYPYRVLQAWGIDGLLASSLTYAVALCLVAPFVPWRRVRQDGFLLLALALAGGGCNVGYVVATLHGEVMRVLLLFYLAPLWTTLFAWTLLGERLSRNEAGIVALSLAGAIVMLWRPELGMPWPAHLAEWLGLIAGLLFALTNVLIRKASSIAVTTKTAAICLGVIGIGLLGHVAFGGGLPAVQGGGVFGLLVVVGLVLAVINPVVQQGLMRVAANRAIVIMLSELVFAAISAWLLAGEAMGLREWAGGSLIVAASLLSVRGEEGVEP